MHINLASCNHAIIISFGIFFSNSFGFLHSWSCHLQAKTVMSFFPICKPFTSFSCLIALTWISSTMMKRNVERHHYKKNKFHFSLFIVSVYSMNDFCILTWYPVTLLKSLIGSNKIFVESVGFSTYDIISSASRNNLTSSFPILIPFLFLANCSG